MGRAMLHRRSDRTRCSDADVVRRPLACPGDGMIRARAILLCTVVDKDSPQEKPVQSDLYCNT